MRDATLGFSTRAILPQAALARRQMSAERAEQGNAEGLLDLSVGLAAVEDSLDDLMQAPSAHRADAA